MTRPQLRASLYAIFAVSGFAGLIYESIWTHYLKLFLGHAAYAQTLVLAIFMGGMALGAWLAAERSRGVRRPLVAYAAIEAVLGVFALAFDPLFRALQGWFFESAVPQLGAPVAVEALKWSLAALVILPQSILLGTTFPLMSAGIIRIAPEMPGRVLSWLYFSNSAGAAVGVLASGFVLIAAVGLPGAIMTAGLLNFLLVLGVWLLLRAGADAAPPAAATEPQGTHGAGIFLAAAFLTGAASFFYEIGWIRMLSLVLGSATHSFEFMLSAFILGLALGGLALRGRVDRLAEPLRFLGIVQVVMATLALLTLPVYGWAFDAMAAVLGAVRPNDGGYVLFNLFSHALCLALMLPVTICAGMTLPLITRLLLVRAAGEAAIGRVYAANTLGAIAGVLLAVHVVMPLLGLREVIVVGAAIDFGLGAWLLWLARRSVGPAGRWALAGTGALALAVAVSVRFDASRLASGVFRTGEAQLSGAVVFHRDGKTASVDVVDYGAGGLSIATNGKADATLRPGAGAEPSEDDYTMIAAGALPLLVHPQLRRVAVVGFGSGRTTHTLLQSAQLESVDTIEIEPAMVEGARAFGPLVAAAYDDPRSRIHIEDAKTFFARGNHQYDAIVSEPSNPWVSGVASLFSREFYRQARRHLAPEGILVQWLQLYEFDLRLAASVFNALGAEFADYTVYLTDGLNVVIVASPAGPVPEPSWDSPAAVGVRELLRHIRIVEPGDLRALRVADRRLLEPWLAPLAPANSDYFPFVDQHAARHRFLRSEAGQLDEIRAVASRLGGGAARSLTYAPTRAAAHAAAQVGQAFRAGQPVPAGPENVVATRALLALRAPAAVCDAPARAAWLRQFQLHVLLPLAPWLHGDEAAAIARALRGSACMAQAPDVLPWIEFFAADAAGDWARVRTLGRKLVRDREWRDPVTDFLVAEILLADLLSGDPGPAVAWLPELRRQTEPAAAVQFLMAQVARAGAAARPLGEIRANP